MKFAVRVHNQHLSKAVQELAFENGYKWQGEHNQNIFERVISKNSPNESLICFESGVLTYTITEWYKGNPIFDAKTDWDKIEQAMKPREPRVIWVNEYKGVELWRSEVHTTLNEALGYKTCPEYARTIKFQEVIEP